MSVRRILLLLALLALSCAEPTRPNLVLITVDTLRADHLGAWGSRLGATPHLDALAESGVVFHCAYTPTPFTMGATTALLTGLHPLETAVYSNKSVLQPDIASLATMLKAQGWRTGAVVSNFALRRGMGLFRGFDSYDDQMREKEAVRDVVERSAPETTAAALRALDDLRRDGSAPFFLWVHYQDPHGPYTPPEELRARFLETARSAADGRKRLPTATVAGYGGIPAYQKLGEENEVAFYRAGYAGEVSFMDRYVGDLLDGLRERGLLDGSVIAFTADHGESLGENDYWFAHGRLLSPALNHVPLILRRPGEVPSRREDVASLLDLLPTLLAAVGERVPDGLRGRDLLAPGAASSSSRVFLNAFGRQDRTGLIADGYMYRTRPGQPDDRSSLVRLGAEEPGVQEFDPRRLRAMRADWESMRARLTRDPRREQRGPLSPRTIERLRALGYAD